MDRYSQIQQFYKETTAALDACEGESSFAGAFYRAYTCGKRELYQKQQTEAKKFDDIWIRTIESYFPSINRITLNLKSNIKYQSEILPIEKTKKIGRESIIHLTSHTHFIQEVTEDGVLPKKILTSLSETEYGIYENRFIMTLILRLRDYVGRRVKIIKQQLKASRVVHLNVESDFEFDSANYQMQLAIKRTRQVNSRITDEHNQNVLTRAEKLYKLISRLCGGQFIQLMKRFKKVSAPIMKTQVILKNPDYKNAYYLWLYLDKTPELGFSLSVDTVNKRFKPLYIKQLNQLHLMLFSAMINNSGFEGDDNAKSVNRQKKAQIVTRLPGETELDPVAHKVEDTGLNEFYLNRSRQILKKQLDTYLEEDSDYKVALKRALQDTIAITNSLFQSYFSINADADVFERLIKEDNPADMMEDAYEKYRVAKIVREVKENDYLSALKLEQKWQKEIAAKQKTYLNFTKDELANRTDEQIEKNKTKYAREIKQINKKLMQEKQQLLRNSKKELTLHERKLKEELREQKARLKAAAKEKLKAEKQKAAAAAAKRKAREREKAKLTKQNIAAHTKTRKKELTQKYTEQKKQLER